MAEKRPLVFNVQKFSGDTDDDFLQRLSLGLPMVP